MSVFGIGDCDECGITDVPIAWMADNDYSLCFECIPAKHDEVRAEVDRLREALRRVKRALTTVTGEPRPATAPAHHLIDAALAPAESRTNEEGER